MYSPRRKEQGDIFPPGWGNMGIYSTQEGGTGGFMYSPRRVNRGDLFLREGMGVLYTIGEEYISQKGVKRKFSPSGGERGE